MDKFAVIDLGSNSVRMGIYSDENTITEHARFRFNTRLAQGLNENNVLQKEPMDKTISALKKCREYIDEHNIKTVISVATESLRRGKNSDEFILRAQKEANINLMVIDGEMEAKYGMAAASTAIDADNYYILDTGGGSFELSLVSNNKLKNFVCLPYGCIVLNDEFAPDKMGTEEVLCFLEQRFKELGFVTSNHYPIVALGGSVKVLASAKGEFCDGEINGKKMASQDVFDLYDDIFATSVSERSVKFNMEESRKDIIVAGLSPIVSLLSITNSEEIYFCTKSIRYGIALDYIKK